MTFQSMGHAQLPAYSYPLFLPPFSDASSQLVAWIEIPTFVFEIQAISLCHPMKKICDFETIHAGKMIKMN